MQQYHWSIDSWNFGLLYLCQGSLNGDEYKLRSKDVSGFVAR